MIVTSWILFIVSIIFLIRFLLILIGLGALRTQNPDENILLSREVKIQAFVAFIFFALSAGYLFG